MKNIKNFISMILVVSLVVFVYSYEDATQAVTTTNTQMVTVSGESFGIKLYTKGVLVISTAEVETAQGEKNPCEDAGLLSGDIIVALDNQEVTTCNEVANIFECCSGKSVQVTYERNDKQTSVMVKPQLCVTSGTYKAGLWIRDSTAGIGTITYYDTKGNFAGLGHGITDVDTGTLMPLGDGEALKSKIVGLSAAEKGTPGELYGVLQQASIGEIKINCDRGIYGTSKTIDAEANYVQVAQPGEIEKGAAKMATTIDGGAVKYYDIEIVRINMHGSSTKDMVIKITDKNLLKKTGGILQGMSGSPIIQNGKFIGAVTHVFVNKPTYGYAVFGSRMVEQSNTL